MADFEKVTKTLEEQLTCPVCRDIFTNPKTLKCLHSFCLKCITGLIDTGKTECPNCRETMELKKEDLKKKDIPNLRPSFHLNSLLQLYKDMSQSQSELPVCANCEKHNISVAYCPQCEGVLCKACLEAHGLTAFVSHKATLFSDFKREDVNCYINNKMYCQVEYHNKNKLDFYCTTCKECICLDCNATEHKLHQSLKIEKEAEEVKKVIKRDMDRANKVKRDYERELGLSKQNMTRIEQETNATIKKVSDEVKQHIKVLRDHETAVIETLQRKLQQQKTKNDEEQREIRHGIESISEFNLRGQKLLDENVPHFIVKSLEELSQRCETLLEKTSILSCKPVKRNASVRYTPNPQVTQALQDIGKVEESVIDPSRCSIESLNDIRCSFVNRFEVVTRDSQSEPSVTWQGSIDIQIQDGDGSNVEKEVSQSETGKYTVTYRAGKPCDYTIHVRICGQEIKNSPQTVKTLDVKDAFKLVKTFGSNGRGRGQFSYPRLLVVSGRGELCHPRSLAVSDRGEIAIADWGNNRIVIFSADGEYLRHFGEQGAGDGQLSNPFDIVFNDDRWLATDNTNGTGRLQEFAFDGTYRRTIYKQYGVVLRGMCTTVENIAVCCEDVNEKKSGIKVFNKESGQLMQEIPSVDKDEVPFNIAYGNDKYFVTYRKKHYVTVFDVNGVFLYKFGEKGNGHGKFNDPRGLAVVSDAILVCDFGNNRVQMVNQDGHYITSFGSPGSDPAQIMDKPMDIAIAPGGQVFVLEWGNHRIHVWR